MVIVVVQMGFLGTRQVLHVLCRRGAAPRFKSRCMDYAQTTGGWRGHFLGSVALSGRTFNRFGAFN